MRYPVLIVITILFIVSCTSRQRIPENVLPPGQMEKILWDIIRADQFVSDYVLPADSTRDNKTERILLYQQVFQIHGITREDFNRSFEFYRSHPALLKPVIDSIYAHSNKAPTDSLLPRIIIDK